MLRPAAQGTAALPEHRAAVANAPAAQPSRLPGRVLRPGYEPRSREEAPASIRQLTPRRPALAGAPPTTSTTPRPASDTSAATSSSLSTGLALTWLGTNSGAPTQERNVSCTLVRVRGATHMVDCGEGTHRQLLHSPGLELQDVDGIFITHLHGDHCFGLGAALLLLDDAKAQGAAGGDARAAPLHRRRHHVCGPPGVADLLRASLVLTAAHRRLRLPLLVTELVTSQAAAHPPRPLASVGGAGERAGGGAGGISVQRLAPQRLHEVPELKAAAHAVGDRVAALPEIWRPPRAHYLSQQQQQQHRAHASSDAAQGGHDSDLDVYGSGEEEGADGERAGPRRVYVAEEGLFWEVPDCAGVTVRAAQLQHRVACWGYAFQEAQPLRQGDRRRKVVVLGDTVSSRAMAPLAAGADALAHEATFAAGMEAKARIAQHSTGAMAGAFAAAVRARYLLLTHFSARYREGPRELESQQRVTRETGAREAEQQAWAVACLLREAAETFGRRDGVLAASDFFTFHVPLPQAASTAVQAGRDGAARPNGVLVPRGPGAR